MDPDFQHDGLPEYPTRHGHHVSWYREWEIDQVFREADAEDEGVEANESVARLPDDSANLGGNSLFKVPAYDSEASGFDRGSVRLLSSSVTGNDGRPIYVLMMGEWEPAWSWFMPFSNYSAPATDWELLTNLDPRPLQVLEVWNARSCPDELLRRSWFVTRVDMSLVEAAKALYGRMLGGGDKVLESLSARIGTKVFEPNDPRVEYLKTEMEMLNHLTSLALKHEEAEVRYEAENLVSFVARLPRREAPLALAAAGDSPDRELAFHSWKVEGSDALVHLMELLGVQGGYYLRVEDDALGILEGASVFDGVESRQGLIQGDCAGSKEAPLRFSTESLRIELADGQSVRLVRVES